jgi:hypothetical protein
VHIRDSKTLKTLKDRQQISPMVADQLSKALSQPSKGRNVTVGTDPRARGRAGPRIVTGESKGEASVRLALQAAFGLWDDGGEVVAELMPFVHEGKRYRVDFALPRHRCYVEIDGWAFHGFTKEAHHSDRIRGLYFSARGWLPFRVSHGQALQSPHILVEALQEAIALRSPVPRDSVSIVKVPHKHGVWYRLITDENEIT